MNYHVSCVPQSSHAISDGDPLLPHGGDVTPSSVYIVYIVRDVWLFCSTTPQEVRHMPMDDVVILDMDENVITEELF